MIFDARQRRTKAIVVAIKCQSISLYWKTDRQTVYNCRSNRACIVYTFYTFVSFGVLRCESIHESVASKHVMRNYTNYMLVDREALAVLQSENYWTDLYTIHTMIRVYAPIHQLKTSSWSCAMKHNHTTLIHFLLTTLHDDYIMVPRWPDAYLSLSVACAAHSPWLRIVYCMRRVMHSIVGINQLWAPADRKITVCALCQHSKSRCWCPGIEAFRRKSVGSAVDNFSVWKI